MYQLMNKDEVLCEFDLEYDESTMYSVTNVHYISESSFPKSLIPDLDLWLEGRSSAKHRKSVRRLLVELQMDNVKGFIDFTKGLSLTDTFWVKKWGEDLRWSRINLFDNEFDRVISRVAFDGGLYGRKFSTTSPEFTTGGMLSKCWVRQHGNIYLMKSGTSGFANTGNEPYSEQYCSELLDVLGFRHVSYKVVAFEGQLVSKCALMTSKQVMLMPLSVFMQTGLLKEIFDWATAHHVRDQLAEYLVFDYLVLNTDRHLNNIGVLVDSTTYSILGLSPIYDNGCGLLPYAMDKDLYTEDGLADYIESREPSLYSNFSQIALRNMSPNMIGPLRMLIDHKFKRDYAYNLTDDRLTVLERMVSERAFRLVKAYLRDLPLSDRDFSRIDKTDEFSMEISDDELESMNPNRK